MTTLINLACVTGDGTSISTQIRTDKSDSASAKQIVLDTLKEWDTTDWLGSLGSKGLFAVAHCRATGKSGDGGRTTIEITYQLGRYPENGEWRVTDMGDGWNIVQDES